MYMGATEKGTRGNTNYALDGRGTRSFAFDSSNKKYGIGWMKYFIMTRTVCFVLTRDQQHS